jgi:1-deoxy-D-xylulose-5-phosphate reductoisomerase
MVPTMKQITLLGATGSIGLRTLDLVSSFPEEFSVAGLAARGSNVERIADLCKKYSPRVVALLEPESRDRLAQLLPAPRPELLAGPEGFVALARDVKADIVVSALVGGAGLLPTMAAIQAGRTVALANKETLVMAGRLMTAAARARGVKLLPVDSEHSAVFQCLAGHGRGDVHRILLTASGGPFRETPKARLATVTVEDALQHPTWKMGAKITIDSATLMNKGLEVIEARWLFDLAPDQVQIVVHPQSIIHSMVEYIDGSVIAQLGVADMGVPILYALTYPERRPTPAARLDLTRVGQLTFFEPDPDKFPCLRLARAALESGGSASVVLNAANEVAVAAFLDRRIGFTEIAELIEQALERAPAGELGSIEACVGVDGETRRAVQQRIDSRRGGPAA